MNLLIDEIPVLETTGDLASIQVTGVEHDSRRVRPGDLFCCVPGRRADGHAFARDAVARGAAGIVCEHLVDLRDPSGGPVAQARVPEGSIRPAMAALAAAFFGFPSRQLLTIGVTGTNGKTTVTQLVAAALEADRRPTTVVGTLTGERTTPEATDLQRLLADLRDRQDRDGVTRAVAMEVSSHALVQSRVDGIHFDVAVFTNLSRDHLDYHGTMERYGAAKATLFEPGHSVQGVVNADDAFGRELLERGRVPLVAVSRALAADVVLAPGRTEFTWRGERVALALTGTFNVDNALLAAEAAVLLGVEPPVVAAGLGRAAVVPGRMEVVAPPGTGVIPFTVLVDYAHTPAALATALTEARALVAPGAGVSVVFGCGGDRDPGKRPAMGQIAARLADRVWLTSDNPRHEDAGAIIDAVRSGVPADADLVVEPDRRAAIERAVAEARPGDVVLVAGKGHETYQQVGEDRFPFDDREVAAAALGERLGGAAGARGG